MAQDVKMFYIKEDIKKIQTKTNLYIQEYGPEGAFHLAREIIQNNVDECIDPESNGSQVDITYDMATDVLTAEDDGRGFPEKDYPLEIFCTTNQSGSKFFRDQGGSSSGEFGVGLTVVNALSDKFILTSYRENENYRHTIEFVDGTKTKDEKKPLSKGDKKHGSKVTFRASKIFLGKNTVLPYKDVIKWIDMLTYFLPTNIKINFEVYDGMKLKEKHKFKAQPFKDILNKFASSNFSQMTYFSGDNKIEEEIKKTSVDEHGKVKVKLSKANKPIHLDVSFRYIDASDVMYESYCNYTYTPDGGIHNDAVDRTICNYLAARAKETQSDVHKEKYPILWDDVRSGLAVAINLSTQAQVRFEGNAKRRIGNKELIPFLVEIVNKGLDDFFKSNPNVLNEYIKIIKLNSKARVDMQKYKAASQKERMNSMSEHSMSNFIRCNNTGKKWKEIFLVEGRSASGSSRDGSDPDTQAFMLFRGVTANPFKCTLAEIMENREWRDFVKVLRCGIGKSFDIEKLYFNRINIMTDEDIDGYGISSGMLAFFYMYYKPIIKAGLLYKVFTPLYKIDDKDHPFVANKEELVALYHKKIAKQYKIKPIKEKNYFGKMDMEDFLEDTFTYDSDLLRISNDLGRINKFVVETIVSLLVALNVIRSEYDYNDLDTTFSDQKFIKAFMSRLQLVYKEVKLNGRVISGVVDGKLFSIKVNHRFIRKISPLISVYAKYGRMLTVEEKGKDAKDMSIGLFLDACSKLVPKILVRFKGLGEMDADDLKSTTLSLENRVSVQYTMEDVEHELDIFKMVHGNSAKDLKRRKVMMEKYKLSRDKLDN